MTTCRSKHEPPDNGDSLVEAYEYDPYGAHTRISDGPDGDSAINWTADDTRTGSAKSAFGATALYTGQRWDAETGLHYYKRRYYDDGLGRFVSRDPIGTWGDYLAMGNGYGYANNGPIEFLDTYGEFGAPPPGLEWPDGAEDFPKSPGGWPMWPPKPCCGKSKIDPSSPCFSCYEWAMHEKANNSWQNTLPNCPCSLTVRFQAYGSGFIVRTVVPPGWNRDPAPSFLFHPGAALCIRSASNKAGHAQQCCYDKQFKLITGGSGAGTPDKVGSEDFGGHLREDVEPAKKCNLAMYHRARTPNNGNKCARNVRK